ncbi:MAG TPA: hypothetical protein VGL86_13440 [Polyangia bacterium]
MRLRLIPPLERQARLVAFGQTLAGKLALIAALAALLWPLRRLSPLAPGWFVVAAVAVTTALPRHRRVVVAVVGALLLSLRVPHSWRAIGVMSGILGIQLPGSFRLISLVEAIVACGLYALVATRFADTRLLRRPLALFLALFVGAACVAAYAPIDPALALWTWGFLFALAPLIWFLAYTLHDRRNQARAPLLVQLGTYTPFWGSTHTPFPKSGAYLSKIEVRSAEELAVWQLKGLKLLAWALLLALARLGFQRVVYESLGVPTVHEAMSSALPIARHRRWASLFANLFDETFNIAVMGHMYIGICRMSGWKALRNTWRPLEALTIAEFFNRFFFYFKELLVDFFFYPTYLRHFKRHPRLRTFAATFAAAAVGNILFHYLRDMEYVALYGPYKAMVTFQTYVLYSVVLGVGVGVSQLRGRRRARSWWRARLANLFVLGFFAVLLVFNDPKRTIGADVYVRWVLGLFGA